MTPETVVWVFVGAGARLPSGAFSTLERAEAWIQQHRLSGLLTAYPLDEGSYDWAVARGHFEPNTDAKRTPEFIGQFSSGHVTHHHYEGGARSA